VTVSSDVTQSLGRRRYSAEVDGVCAVLELGAGEVAARRAVLRMRDLHNSLADAADAARPPPPPRTSTPWDASDVPPWTTHDAAPPVVPLDAGMQPVAQAVHAALDAMQRRLYLRARARRDAAILQGVQALDQFALPDLPDAHAAQSERKDEQQARDDDHDNDDDAGGAARMGHNLFLVPWHDDDAAREAHIQATTKRTLRCLPLDAPGFAIFARAY
jgi:hypothetical protein